MFAFEDPLAGNKIVDGCNLTCGYLHFPFFKLSGLLHCLNISHSLEESEVMEEMS